VRKKASAALRRRPVRRRLLLGSIILDPPEFKGSGHHFELRATIRAGDNFAFLDIVFLKIQAILTFGTQNFVPVGKSAGGPSHDYFSIPAGGTPGGEHLVYGRGLIQLRLSSYYFTSAALFCGDLQLEDKSFSFRHLERFSSFALRCRWCRALSPLFLDIGLPSLRNRATRWLRVTLSKP